MRLVGDSIVAVCGGKRRAVAYPAAFPFRIVSALRTKFIADSSLLETMRRKGNRATVATTGKGGQGRAV